MARYDYTNIYNTAVALISRFGAEYVHRMVDTSFTKTYDPTSGSNVWTNGTTSYTEPQYTEELSDGVIVDFTEEERRDTSIKVGDKKLLSVEITTPQSQDIFIIGGVEYSYINHTTIQPASTSDPLLYKVQLRV